MSINIGKILVNYRCKYNYSQFYICNGICSISNFSDYENEEKIPDVLTMTYILERIGYIPRGLIVYISKDSKKYLDWYRECNKAIQAGEYKKISDLYHKKVVHASMNQKIVRQFELYLQGIISEKNEENIKAAENYYYQALKCTCDDFECIPHSLMGYSELKIFWNYLNVCQLQGKNVSLQVEAIENYIYDCNWSDEQIVKILPNFTILGCKCENFSHNQDNLFVHLKHCLNLLVKNNSLNCIIDIYTAIIEIGKKLQFGMANYEADLKLLTEMYEEFNIKTEPDYSIFNESFMYEVVGDYLKNARKKKSISQEYLSEGICAVESYNRIENGRQPTKKKYESICRKLGIENRYYLDQISADTIETLKLKDDINDAINSREYTNALCLIEKLKILLDSQNITDKQYIKYQESRIGYMLKEINSEEYCEHLKDLLGYTLNYNDICKPFHTYTLLETKIINNIIVQEYKLGQVDSAIKIAEYMIKILDSQKYDSGRFYDLKKTKINLGKMLSDISDTSRSLKLFFESISENLERKNAFQLEESLAEASFILLKHNPRKSSKLCLYAMLICKIYNKVGYYKKLQSFYKKEFE